MEGYKEMLHAIPKCVICVNTTAERIRTYALTTSPRLQHAHVLKGIQATDENSCWEWQNLHMTD